MPVTRDNVHAVFTYQPPSPEQVKQYTAIREAAGRMAFAILDNTPVCADQQAALRLLRECVMTANAAIALKGAV